LFIDVFGQFTILCYCIFVIVGGIMNAGNYTYTENFIPGTYTVKVRVYAAAFLGSTYSRGVSIGAINTWSGGGNMTNSEQLKAASNKLIITYL